MGAKMPQKATLIGGYFLRLIMSIKITHSLSVLQPKVIVFTKGYLKRHNNKEVTASVIVCTTYSVLRLNYLIKNSHIIFLLLSYLLVF